MAAEGNLSQAKLDFEQASRLDPKKFPPSGPFDVRLSKRSDPWLPQGLSHDSGEISLAIITR
jgi:hypothetical protein